MKESISTMMKKFLNLFFNLVFDLTGKGLQDLWWVFFDTLNFDTLNFSPIFTFIPHLLVRKMDLESDLVPLCPQNNFKTHVYPSSVEFLLCILGLVIGSRVLLEIDTSFGLIDWFESSIISSWVTLSTTFFLCSFFFFSLIFLYVSLRHLIFRIKSHNFLQIFQSKSNHKWIVIMYSIRNHYMVGKGNHHEVHTEDVTCLQRMDVRIPGAER